VAWHRIVLAVSEVLQKLIKSANFLTLLILFDLWKRKREGFEAPDRYLLFVFAVLFFMSVFYAMQIYYFSTRHSLTLILPSLLSCRSWPRRWGCHHAPRDRWGWVWIGPYSKISLLSLDAYPHPIVSGLAAGGRERKKKPLKRLSSG
jgi:hypothetical protein